MADERLLVRLHGILVFWPWYELWHYIITESENDPLDILRDERNLYAVERAEYLGRQRLTDIFYNGGDE